MNKVASKQVVTVNVNGKNKEILVPFPSPEDWRDTWIYFIMTDRFNNPDAKPRSKLGWNDPNFNDFQGGNFRGITDKLDYLKELGAGAIWITPPFKNCQYEPSTYHGYGIQDFINIDPRFGTEDDLAELVREAHAREMYVIFDIVLNHAGNVFSYRLANGEISSEADWTDSEYDILWHNDHGNPEYPNIPVGCKPDECIWPTELQKNVYFRRKGKGGEAGGDFYSLKEFDTSWKEVKDAQIKSFQYAIARFDVDGFRIDTLKYIERDYARIFGNSMREFALSIGKKNFFTFGEVWDSEEKIAQYIGRYTGDDNLVVGVDAALDFPLFYKLPGVIKGFLPPSDIANTFEYRKHCEENLISSHGEAGRYFVTFQDNHDQKNRFYYDDGKGTFDEQVTLGIGSLFTLQGVPCIYYGTEQGLCGSGNSELAVREALWGKPNPFDPNHKFYKAIRDIGILRRDQPALRYGRQYFRPISGDGGNFGISPYSQGVLAFSRILNEAEILVLINTNANDSWSGYVTIDSDLSQDDTEWQSIYSNKNATLSSIKAETTANRRAVKVTLAPLEINILKKV